MTTKSDELVEESQLTTALRQLKLKASRLTFGLRRCSQAASTTFGNTRARRLKKTRISDSAKMNKSDIFTGDLATQRKGARLVIEIWGSFLMIHASSAWAQTPSITVTNFVIGNEFAKIQASDLKHKSSKLDPDKPRECQVYSECQSAELERLRLTNDVIDKKISQELNACTPQIFGYNYKKATSDHKTARRNFEHYLASSCNAIENTLGPGTGITSEVLNCKIELRKMNLQRSNQFLVKILETRDLLKLINHGADNSKPSILCK